MSFHNGYFNFKCGGKCGQVWRRRTDNLAPCPNCGGLVHSYTPGSQPLRSFDERIDVGVKLPPDLHKRLKHEAYDRGTSVSHLVTKAATYYLDRLPPLEPEPS